MVRQDTETRQLPSRFQCFGCQRPDGFKKQYRGQGMRPSGLRSSCKHCGYIRKEVRA